MLKNGNKVPEEDNKNLTFPGEDAIIAKLLKSGWKDLITQLKLLVSILWKQEEIPTRWHVSVLFSIQKTTLLSKSRILNIDNFIL